MNSDEKKWALQDKMLLELEEKYQPIQPENNVKHCQIPNTKRSSSTDGQLKSSLKRPVTVQNKRQKKEKPPQVIFGQCPEGQTVTYYKIGALEKDQYNRTHFKA